MTMTEERVQLLAILTFVVVFLAAAAWMATQIVGMVPRIAA